MLYHSAGITKHLRFPGGTMPFRAASCTGALYHIELYVVCADLPGLAAGVYQYGAHDHALRRLRTGDFREALVAATGAEPSIAHAPVTLVYTSTFWRNTWKYQARAYRHAFWDSGTIIANTLAMAAAHDLPARVVLGYADAEVNRLVGVDADREAAVALVALGRAAEPPGASAAVDLVNLETLPLSAHEVEYPAIRAFHEASSLETAAEAAAWRAHTPSGQASIRTHESDIPLAPLPASEWPQDPIEVVIRRRGSSRHFAGSPISFNALSTMLRCAAAGFPTDFRSDETSSLADCYVIANAVEGLAPGTYALSHGAKTLEPLRTGSFRREAGFLALMQELGATAAANVYFLAELPPILEQLGNRGYRAAQLDAAIAGGRIYLAAYALGLGASGLTFFDDEVTAFFSPHAKGKSVLFLTAVGAPARRTAPQ